MGEIALFEDAADYQRVIIRIRRLWNEGAFEILPHAQERLLERGLDVLDIQHCIRFGKIKEHNKPIELWRYKIKGKAVDGEPMACIVEINGSLIVVTVIRR